MMKIGNILRNNLRRVMGRKNNLITTLALTIAVMALAIYFTTAFEMKQRIAIVTTADTIPISSEEFHIQRLEEAPPKSQLVRNKYDAVVIDQGEGEFVIQTIKDEEFEQKVRQALEDPEQRLSDGIKRGAGANILGYLIILMLLEGMFFMNFFSEDKTSGTLRRIGSAPLSIIGYLSAQGLFCFLMIYVPTYLLLIVVKLLFPIDIGFTLIQYAWMLGLLALLATSFALFMTAWIENPDNTVMLASSMIILTSLLSGSFYTFEQKGVMEVVTSFLPQKQFLKLVQGLDQHMPLSDAIWPMSYVIVFSILLFVAGGGICRSRFRDGRY